MSYNHIFQERTGHIKVDYHCIWEKIVSGDIKIRFVNYSDLLADIFTKSLQGLKIDYICNQLDTYDLYA